MGPRPERLSAETKTCPQVAKGLPKSSRATEHILQKQMVRQFVWCNIKKGFKKAGRNRAAEIAKSGGLENSD